MKESRVKWITNRWPLIDMLMSRADCLEWLASQGYPEPPKSACYFCPFNSNYKWAKMKRDDPDSFRKAVEWERAVNAARAKTDFIKNPLYVHRTMQPLDQVDFERQDQLKLFTDGFGNECEGMCGV
jgi:hypothetical protein